MSEALPSSAPVKSSALAQSRIAVLLLEDRAPGRSHEVIAWARSAGMVKRIAATDGEPLAQHRRSPVWIEQPSRIQPGGPRWSEPRSS